MPTGENQQREPLEDRVQRVLQDPVEVVPYDPAWPQMFESEKEHLRQHLPNHLIGRIEHFGSTAVPGLAAKPTVDMLVEVPDLEEVRETVPPLLPPPTYDYFWRPTFGDDGPPFYAWFIKRNETGNRTHHIHMVEPDFEHWDRLLFRDYLIAHPNVAREYGKLKMRLATRHPTDRIAYTEAKTEFILRVTRHARRFYS
jgi:GrpB-like predicted nucleotidyltransferase (UPF0157 family)